MAEGKKQQGLPIGWATCKLNMAALIKGGFAFKSTAYQSEGVPLIRISNISDECISTSRKTVYLKENYLEECSDFLLQKGDILIALSGATTGKFGIYNLSSQALLNQRVARLRPELDEMPNAFFYYLLFVLRKSILDRAYGAAQPNISVKELGSFNVPLPPLAEQRRIVDKVEELFSDLDAGVAALEKVRAEIKRYRQAVLKHAFEGKLTEQWRQKNKDKVEPASKLLERIKAEREKNTTGKKQRSVKPVDTGELLIFPKTWENSRLYQLCYEVTDGDHQAPPKASDGVPFLVISNINKSFLDFTKTRFVPETYYAKIQDNRKPRRNDILYSVTGSFGIPVVVNTDRQFCFQRHIALIRPAASINLQYLYYVLKSRFAFDQATQVATGTAQLTVPLSGLRNFVIPIPSEQEQQQIVSEIERRLSIADNSEKIVEQALKQAGRLRQSILKRAFEGKLVPQDPNDEPAEKLLERIKSEKEN